MALLTEENVAEYLPLFVTDHSNQLRTVIDPDVLGKHCHLCRWASTADPTSLAAILSHRRSEPAASGTTRSRSL
jgi:hypothetical protein